MASRPKIKAAIIGSGNIGTDLMIKIIRTSKILEMAALVGVDPESDGLKRAEGMGVAITHEGLEGLTRLSTRLRQARTSGTTRSPRRRARS
jgi:acetaldehyde dehydrogenase